MSLYLKAIGAVNRMLISVRTDQWERRGFIFLSPRGEDLGEGMVVSSMGAQF